MNVKFQFDSPGILSEELQFYLAFIEEHAGNSVKRVSGQNSSDLAMNTLLKDTCDDLDNQNRRVWASLLLSSGKTSPGFSIKGSREML